MDLFNDKSAEQIFDIQLCEPSDLTQLILRFIFNFVMVGIMIHFFYYPKSRRRDYYFTFSLINVSVFLLIFLLGSVKLKIGFALGIFAIFGIIRYRTESVPIREMTYLFIIIAMSVINALSVQFSIAEMVAANAMFVVSTWVFESERWLKHTACKYILYDKIELIKPDMRPKLIADLEERTGMNIIRVEIGHIDFLRDAAMLSVYYEPESKCPNTADELTKLPHLQL